MVYKLRQENGVDICDLEGQVKGTDNQQFIRLMNSLLDKDASCIGINFAQTAFIDSGCIGALMMAKRKADQKGLKIVVYNLSEDIRDLFEMTNMHTCFPIFSSEKDMLQTVLGPN
jgi:anti-anti-sigma factor